jgi:hypothetical protein
MTNTIILLLAGTLLWAYIVDIAAKRYSIPAVIPLVASGLAANTFLHASGWGIRWLDVGLPVLGTVGLILIVLEGALGLQLRRENAGLMRKASISALLGFIGCAIVYTLLAKELFDLSLYASGALAIPFAVISSAVAIPSGRNLPPPQGEFVIYESSISDILGVLVFFAWLDAGGNLKQFAIALGNGSLFSLALGALFSLALLWLIGKISGHIRFLPILAMLFFLYAVGKALHLSPLILVLGFGLLLNNADLLANTGYLKRLVKSDHAETLGDFKSLVMELEFAVRSVFFIMLGLWTPLESLRNPMAWLTAAGILCVLLALRYALLKLLGMQVDKLVWLAPRGLITVLLLLTAMDRIDLGAFPQGAVMLTVLLSCLLVLLARHRKSDVAVNPGKSPDSV